MLLLRAASTARTEGGATVKRGPFILVRDDSGEREGWWLNRGDTCGDPIFVSIVEMHQLRVLAENASWEEDERKCRQYNATRAATTDGRARK